MIWDEPCGDFMLSQGWVSTLFGIIAKFGQFRNEKRSPRGNRTFLS